MAIELAPNDVGILASQGACLIRLGRFEDAIRVLYSAQKKTDQMLGRGLTNESRAGTHTA